MYHSIHSDFIETPLIEILKEGVQACRPLGVGIHTEPMKEYFLSSLFLRMTGAQEQKLKCICWELATHDYDFRNDYLKDIGDSRKYGEFSSFTQREKVYNDLLRQLFLLNEGNRPRCTCLENYKKFSQSVYTRVKMQLEKEPLYSWLQKEIQDLEGTNIMTDPSNAPASHTTFSARKKEWPPDGYKLFQKDLRSIYDLVVKQHRNKCAHNLTSVQNHLPNLDQLKKPGYPRQNYVYRFVILILIDEIFMGLYKEYKRLVNMSPWR